MGEVAVVITLYNSGYNRSLSVKANDDGGSSGGGRGDGASSSGSVSYGKW